MENTFQWDHQQIYIDLVWERNQKFVVENGRQPVCHIHTYGCQQNVSDGEKLKGMLAEMGYTFSEVPEGADFVLYNTCAVRENAEDRVFGNVGALKHQKARNPDMLIGLCGCMVQQEHIAAKVKKSYPYVDLVFGTHALYRLPELLHRALTENGRVVEVSASDGDIVEAVPLRRDGRIKAWVPIMYGCNNFCTYCVVPFVRGRERSREPDQIVEEVRGLAAAGYKEITLLGQNVNSYGKTLANPISFAALLRQLDAIPGEFRIRFMTSHPRDCTRELIDAIADCRKVVNHLHLPVQSGSNRILKEMNRHYTREQYLELIRYAKDQVPGITFTSDIIVGFPGETYEDFLDTISLIREVEYLSLFTFVYSRRSGTKAAEMDDPVPREEKMRWFQQLLDTQTEVGFRQYKANEGKTLRVLAEAPGRKSGIITGRTESNVIVNFSAGEDIIGQFLNLRVTRARQWSFDGVPV